MKPATTIELHDLGIVFTTDEDFAPNLGGAICGFYGSDLVDLVELLGVDVREDAVGPTGDVDFSFIFRGEPYKEMVADLQAQVDGPNLVTFQLRRETTVMTSPTDWDMKSTHSGRFTIHWAKGW